MTKGSVRGLPAVLASGHVCQKNLMSFEKHTHTHIFSIKWDPTPPPTLPAQRSEGRQLLTFPPWPGGVQRGHTAKKVKKSPHGKPYSTPWQVIFSDPAKEKKEKTKVFQFFFKTKNRCYQCHSIFLGKYRTTGIFVCILANLFLLRDTFGANHCCF